MMTLPLTLAVALHLFAQETPRPESPPASEVQAPAPVEAPPPPSPQTRTEARTARPTLLSRVTLNDGQVLRGYVLEQDERHLVLELPSGGRMDLSAKLVESVEEEKHAEVRSDGEVWFQDPNRTRYLYAPSAMMLRQGEGYFSQKELFFSSFNYGLTDHLTLQAGAAVPIWFVEKGQGLNFIGGLKAGGSVAEQLHLAVGLQGLVAPFLFRGVAGLAFGTATLGTPDAHLSVALGTPFYLAENSDFTADAIVAISGNVRLSRGLALVSENWLLPSLDLGWNSSLPLVGSLAARIFGEHWAVDLGLIYVPQVGVPVPWLDFSYNFGGSGG